MSETRKHPMPARVERGHSRECFALKAAREGRGGPFTVLMLPSPEVFCNRFANPKAKIGRRHMYIRVKCNDPKCPATALVHLSAALEAVGLNTEASADAVR